jgi:FKBP-type peptidyl-prolyl cis-trans isomerase FkpA
MSRTPRRALRSHLARRLLPLTVYLAAAPLVQAQTGNAGPASAVAPQTAASAQPAARPAPSAFAQRAAREPGAVVTDSGLVFRELRAGDGARPVATDLVRVHYRGTLAGGKEFDSSYKRGQIAAFTLDSVIPCWTEGLQRMRVGAKAVLTCPPAIAYGADGSPPVVPANATLRFEVELFGIMGR